MRAPSRVIVAAPLVLTAVLGSAGCSPQGADGTTRISTRFEQGVIAPEGDLGSSADRAAVRRAVLGALTDEDRAFDVDPALRGEQPSQVLAALLGAASARERAVLLGRARSAELATDLRASFSFYARKEFGPRWTGSGSRAAWLDRDVRATGAFHVDQWQGVQVEHGVARVLLRGEDRGTGWDGASRRDLRAQYKLILHRDATAPNGWRVVAQQAATTAA